MYAKLHWGDETSGPDHLRRRAEELLAKAKKSMKTSDASTMDPLSRKTQREILETQRERLRRHGIKKWTRNGV